MAETDHDSPGNPQGAGGGPPDEEIPRLQQIFDSPFLLLVACLVIFFVFYTGWGVVEMMSLPDAPLP